MAPITTQEPGSSFQTTIAQLADRVEDLLKRQTQDTAEKTKQQRRALIGLAGVPGSGKSTVSAALMVELSKRGVGIGDEVVVVPMVSLFHTRLSQGGITRDISYTLKAKHTARGV